MAAPSVSIEDGRLLDLLQDGIPLVERPFAAMGEQIGMSENELIGRIAALKEARIVREIGAIFDTRRLGYHSSLVALQLPPSGEDEAAEVVNRHPGVSHTYRRNHAFNLWFTIAVPPTSRLGLDRTVEVIARDAKADSARVLPALRLYKVGVKLDAPRETPPGDPLTPEQVGLVRALQQDVALVPAPYAEAAGRLGTTEAQLLAEATRMMADGRLLRVAARLAPRAAGFRANAMGVFAVPEERVDQVGDALSDYNAVSHCYRRPVYPDWPYALFTMAHGRNAAECEATIESMATASGVADYRALYSTKEYRKVRPSYFPPELARWEEETLGRGEAERRA